MSKPSTFTSDDFRAELNKRMPGYRWTIRRPRSSFFLCGTGIQSSGFNRTSTLEITRRSDGPLYEVAGFGYGTRGPVMGRACGRSLAEALRGLQELYGNIGAKYTTLERALEQARVPGDTKGGTAS